MTTKRIGGTLAVALAAAFFVQAYFGSLHKSLTWDEPVYIAAGYAYLQWKFFHLNPSHPPLLQYLAGLPLLFMKPQVPWDHRVFRLDNQSNPIVDFAKKFIFHSGNDVVRIAHWARLSRQVLGTLLILSIYLWGRRLYGDGPALFATAFAAFCPNLIAHAKLATEDLGCTMLMFVSVWTLWYCIHSRSPWAWALAGLVTGLALVSKYTALLLVPIFLFLIGASWLRNPADRRLRSDVRNLGLLSFVSIIVVGASYDFSFDYTYYINGLGQIYRDTVPIQYYLLGETYTNPKWYYFVVAALMKTPVTTLLMLGAAAVSAIMDREHRETQLFLLLPAAVIVGASFFDATNIGLRRILPAFPFLLLFGAQFLIGPLPRLRFAAAWILLVLTMVSTIRIYPDHLAYFNEAVGGPEMGPYLLADSNLDWGQNLPALARWQQMHPEATPIRLRYFGLADPASYGVSAVSFPEEDFAAPKPGFYAVSAHDLAYNHDTRATAPARVDWLARYEPIERLGYSIYIYHFPPETGQKGSGQ